MNLKNKIVITVINDLTYDRRMARICESLTGAGYNVLLTGRLLLDSKPLQKKKYRQHRIRCIYKKGKLFYFEYNLRLFLFLLFNRFDYFYSVDLDTLFAGYSVSLLKRKPCIYDAHEYFPEVPEVFQRNFVKKIWLSIERKIVPRLKYAITVSDSIAEIYFNKYNVKFEVIRNLPVLIPNTLNEKKTFSQNNDYIIYQGALNKGRALFVLLEAIKNLKIKLLLIGEGDLSKELREYVETNNLQNKVIFQGYIEPSELGQYTNLAIIGINLLDEGGLNNYYSLSNKYFDYIHACIPSISNDFPEYKKMNSLFETSVLLSEITPEKIGFAIHLLLTDKEKYIQLIEQCEKAKKVLNWQNEEIKLLNFFRQIK